MKLHFCKLFLVFISCCACSLVSANRYWPEPALSDWSIVLNNGVVYIQSPQFPAHCSHSRGQINIHESEFDRAQYAFVLSAKARGKKLKYVVDNTQTVCVISGVLEID